MNNLKKKTINNKSCMVHILFFNHTKYSLQSVEPSGAVWHFFNGLLNYYDLSLEIDTIFLL